MISDTIFDAECEIVRYLVDFPDAYPVGSDIRMSIERLLEHMDSVRLQRGMDTPPQSDFVPAQRTYEDIIRALY